MNADYFLEDEYYFSFRKSFPKAVMPFTTVQTLCPI